MNHLRPTGAIRQLLAFAAPMDRDHEVFRSPAAPRYRHHMSIKRLPENEVAASLAALAAWCDEHGHDAARAVGRAIAYATLRWARKACPIDTTEAVAAVLQFASARLTGRSPDGYGPAVFALYAAAMQEWRAQRTPYEADACLSTQQLIADYASADGTR